MNIRASKASTFGKYLTYLCNPRRNGVFKSRTYFIIHFVKFVFMLQLYLISALSSLTGCAHRISLLCQVCVVVVIAVVANK